LRFVDRRLMTRRGLPTQALAFFLMVLMAYPSWAATPTITPQLPNPGSVGMTREQQIQLGQKVVAEVYKQMPVLPDSSPLTQYVQQLGKKLQTVIPSQYSWPYQFHVVQQKEINAFALPGGPIFVNVGTVTAADNEAELAGVIAHEMSHVYMQHSAKQASKNTLPSILAGIGQIAGKVFGGVGGAIASMGGQMVGGMLSMKYSRADEAQADAVGAIIMYKDSYDPRQMAEFFQKLEKMGGGGPQFLSDHPNPGNRVEAVNKEIASWPPKRFTPTSQQFLQAKQQASGTKAYTAQEIADGAKTGAWASYNQQHGSIPKDVQITPASAPGGQPQGGAAPPMSPVSYEQIRPSGNFKELQQNGFTISYPDNWQAGNDQNGITIAPQAGVSQGGIAYGVVIGAGNDPNASSLDQATQHLVQSLEQQQSGMRETGTMQTISINGAEGRSVNFSSNSPIQNNGQPVPEHDWLVTASSSQGGLVYLIFIAPESEFSKLRPTYQHMLDSLQVH
jgi:beta-barrel assembly-enhancing protease